MHTDTPAIARAKRLARVVFVSHPFSANPYENTKRVQEICRNVVRGSRLPLAPQIYLPQFVDEATERDLALRLCLDLVALADEVWAYGEPTSGMRTEIAEARRLGISVVAGDAAAEIVLTGEPPR